jgi:hypothetical protein
MAPVNCTIPLDENLLPITLKYGPTVEAENKLNSTRFPMETLGKAFTYLVELVPEYMPYLNGSSVSFWRAVD